MSTYVIRRLTDPDVRPELSKMLKERRKDKQSLLDRYVEMGILTKSGRLTKRYGGKAENEETERSWQHDHRRMGSLMTMKPRIKWVAAIGCWVCGMPSKVNAVGLWPCGHGDTPRDAWLMWRQCW